MLFNRRIARDFLLNTDRPKFLEIIYKAKVTPRQKEISYRYLLDKQDYGLIADALNISQETVKTDLQKVYDLTYNYLLNNIFIPN